MHTLNKRLLATLLCAAAIFLPNCSRAFDLLLPFNSLWFYLDNGVDQGTVWRQPAFDDSFWNVGQAQFGFGEDDEMTVLDSFPNGPLNTAYFRTYFSVGNVGTYSNLTLRGLRDDGAVVYLNGVEVFRSNMPTGAVSYATKAVRNIDGDDELIISRAQRVLPASVLVSGLNSIAVEVHQAVGGDDDMSFTMLVIGHRTGENQPPSASPSFVTVEQNKSVSFVLNASDPDSDPLDFTISDPIHGSLSGVPPNLTYTPAPGYVGPDLFSFSATDGQWSTEVAEVGIEVKAVSNHPPVADAQSVTVAEDNSVTIALTATDPDGDSLSYTFTQTSHGTLSAGPGHSVVYQPAPNYNGPDSFNFTVDDGHGATASASISITVTAVNDVPVPNGQNLSTPEDTALEITLSASDVEGDALTYSYAQPSHGTVTGTGANIIYHPAANYYGPDSFTFTVNDGNGGVATASVNISVTPVNDAPTANSQSVSTLEDTSVNITLSGSDVDGDALSFSYTQPTHGAVTGIGPNVTYHPAANYNGPDNFTFTVNDGNGGIATASVNISVTPVNDAPTANSQSVSTLEDTSVNVTLSGSDVDGDALSFSYNQPAHGTVTGTGANVTYHPAANYNGPDSFTFTVNDGNGGVATASINISVTPVNDAPTANSQSVSTLEDTSVNITLSGSDVDGDALSFSYAQPAHGTVTGTGANVVYHPAADYNGPDSFTFTVNDGNGGVATASINISVLPVNDAPVANPQSVSTPEDTVLNVTLSANDVDGDTLTYSYTQPAHGTVTGTGANVAYQPDANYNGPDSFTFTIDDGNGGVSTATVSVTVTAVNDAPVARAMEAPASHPEDLTRQLRIVATNNQSARVYLDGSASTDIDGDSLSFAWYRNTETLPFSTLPSSVVAFAVGSHVLSLTVSDGNASSTDSITLQVVTPGDLVKVLAAHVQAAALKPGDRKNLLDHLKKACTAFDRGNIGGGVHELVLFQEQVTKKVAPYDAALAKALKNEAQQIIQAVTE